MPIINLGGFKKYYFVNGKCSNCQNYQEVRILKGTTIKSYFENCVCDNCGCKTLTYPGNDADIIL